MSDKIRNVLSIWLREILLPFFYFYNRSRINTNLSYSGDPLKPGITAVVAARNESYTISLCLQSLLPVVDQIVCIDNGSDDDTLQQMNSFKEKYGEQIQVNILSMPGALLGECRQAGLKATKHQWHLRWDADMVCKTSGEESMVLLRESVLKETRPKAIQLPRTNLIGDLHHTHKLASVVDPGEPILVWFNQDIRYKEYGKFDTIRIPFYYKRVEESKRYYFHCEGLKSDANLIHRFHYFSWREQVNKAIENPIDFESYKEKRNLELFCTNQAQSLKYRFMKQLVFHFKKYEENIFGAYPETLKKELESGKERFDIQYKNGRPCWRVDKEDKEMLNYQPTQEDLEWDPVKFLEKFLTAKELEIILS